MSSSSSKRRSILSPVTNVGPQAPVNASSSAKVSDNSILTGTHSITIQSESVIHPRARLESTSGSILVGRRCIVHERTHVGSTDGDESSGGVVLGDHVTVETGSVIEAGGTEIGEGTVVGVRARIGKGAQVGKVCPSGVEFSRGMPQLTKYALELHDHAAVYRQAGRDHSRFYRHILERSAEDGQAWCHGAAAPGPGRPCGSIEETDSE